MRILFFLGHPAQYLFLKNTLLQLEKNPAIQFKILIKKKDVLEKLIIEDGFSYENVLMEERSEGWLGIIKSFSVRFFRIFKIAIKYKPDLFWSGDPATTFIGRLLGKGAIVVGEDDYPVIYKLARITYPFATAIICPNVCDVGSYKNKKIGYDGYMKLAYLHPSVFVFNENVLTKYIKSKKYALVRLSELKAYHDDGIGGVTEDILDELVVILNKRGFDVFISSEGKINEKYVNHLIKPNPSDMVHILAGASIFIGDSQSMTVEACMLGIPSIRFSGLAGKISVLEELEHKYKLTFGINCLDKEALISTLETLVTVDDFKKDFLNRRDVMLKDKINVSEYITSLITNYPYSLETELNVYNRKSPF